MKNKAKSQIPTQLPIHFKKPGRSYSQIGRNGNVALYQVFSDYLIVPDFAQPYLTIGFELVIVKTKPDGSERYPRNEEFGSSGWSIPKSLSRFRLPRSRMRSTGWNQFTSPIFKTLPNRSASSADCTCQIVATN